MSDIVIDGDTPRGRSANGAAAHAGDVRDIADLEKLASLLDTRFRLLGIRFGYDALLGLLPGIGDAASLGISTYVVARAWQLGARKRTIARMGGNLVGDALLGAIPLAGTIVDVGWKANRRNVDLLRRELGRIDGRDRTRPPRTG